jgi:hypothetical protein
VAGRIAQFHNAPIRLAKEPPMSNQPAARAMTAAVVSLVAFGACFYMLLALTVDEALPPVPKIVLAAVGMASSVVLHLVFVALAAQRLQRRPWVWVLIALLGFPVSSIVGLIMLAFFEEERTAQPFASR